jgi:DNA-binding MarR family transcriptional regulator
MNKLTDFENMSKFSGPEESPGYLLWRVSTQWRAEIEKELKLCDLTHPQFVLLAVIGWLSRKNGISTQIEISRAAAMDPNTVSQVIRGLEAKKLIKRVQKKDARSKNAFLTDKGIEVLAQALPAVEAVDTNFFAVLTLQEQKEIAQLFQKLIK